MRWLVFAVVALFSVRAQDDSSQMGYVTAAPVPETLGLATLGGRDAIQVGSGCEAVAPGVNVIRDETNGELSLRVVDPIRGPLPDVCTVVFHRHMSDVPCATNPSGTCDVAFS
jgi:hypothetical protein